MVFPVRNFLDAWMGTGQALGSTLGDIGSTVASELTGSGGQDQQTERQRLLNAMLLAGQGGAGLGGGVGGDVTGERFFNLGNTSFATANPTRMLPL